MGGKVQKPTSKENAAGNTAKSTGGGKSTDKSLKLHRAAALHSLDGGLDTLQKILDDPECDYGTALLIFWKGAPGYDKQFQTADDAPPWRRPILNFTRRVEARLLAGEFSSRLIAFDPKWDTTTVNPEGYDWTADHKNVPANRPIPDQLMKASC